MGWASGSSLMDEIIDAAVEVGIDDVTRKEFYEKIIEAFEDQDCDTLQECEGKDTAFDAAIKAVHPEWYEEQDESEWKVDEDDDK